MFVNWIQFCAQAKCKHKSPQINRLEYAPFTQIEAFLETQSQQESKMKDTPPSVHFET